MATANNGDEQLKCSVCKHNCNGPRKLPECGHSCCETCILIYVSKLKDDGDLDIGFPCPTCKEVNSGPKDLKAAIEWIKSLEKGTDPVSEVDTSKKQTHTDTCDSCRALGRSSRATKLCLDCNETLCQSCSEVRHIHKLFRSHKLVNLVLYDDKSEKENKLFQMLCELISCERHLSNPIAFYCEDHDELGCESCVDTEHKQCSDVVKANVCVDSESIKSENEQIKASSENLCTYANTMLDKRKDNREANKKKVELIKANLKAIRSKVNELFDHLEDSTLKKAQSIAEKYLSAEHKETQILEKIIRSSTYSVALIEKFMTHGSLTQLNIIIQKIKERMKTNEDAVLNMSQTFKTFTIEFKQEETLLRLLNLGYELVTVTEKEDANCSLPYQSRLLLKQYKVKTVRTISTQQTYQWTYPRYTSVMILHNNSIVVVDTDRSCIVIKPNNEILEPCNLSTELPTVDDGQSANNSVCLTRKKEELIAVPYPSQKKILLISVNEAIEIKRAVNTMYHLNALQILKNGDVAVAWDGPVAFGIISIGEIFVATKVYFRQDNSGREFKSFQFIAVDERRAHVIQPCTSDSAVYCFDFEGNPKFKYTVSNPQGVALDGDCNIYACSSVSYNHCIHVISPSGAGLRILSKTEGWSSYPLAIAFNKDGDEFAVTQVNHHVITVFKLQNE